MKSWGFVLISLVLPGCIGGVGPDYVAPNTPADTSFVGTQPLYSGEAPPSSWWTLFGDEALDGLVSAALAQNRDVAVARESLRAVRAVYTEQRADFFPTLGAGASYSRQRPSAAAQGLARALPDQDFYDGAFDAAWEIDLFGAVRRNVQAARADAEAAEARLNDVQVSVAAETARAYVELRGAQVRLDVASRNADNQQRTYDLTVKLTEGGRGSQLDVARARAQSESTLAAITALQAEEAATTYRLAVLTGQQPRDLAGRLLPSGFIPRPPDTMAIGTPVDMLRRRPDVRAAERVLAGATARIGVATAELFPRITLTGTVGLAALDAGRLTENAALQFAAGPSLTWSIFDLARVRARIAQADAQAAARLASFEQTVLSALQEAESALTRFARERERTVHLSAAAEASAEAARLAEQRYSGGIDSFLSVLDAQRSLLQAEDGVAQSRVALAAQFIAIQKALGAGWSAPGPTQTATAQKP